jgi:KTSC domain
LVEVIVESHPEALHETRFAMQRVPVESSLIRAVGYDPDSSVLELEFLDPRRVYLYYDVPFSTFEELLVAESKGTYFNDLIKDLYAFEEGEGDDDSASPREPI